MPGYEKREYPGDYINMRSVLLRRSLALAAILAIVAPAQAQTVSGPPAVDPASVPMPNLVFTPTDEDVRNYDKYFYFHREGNDFASAYSDLQECDAYARGLAFRTSASAVYVPVGGVLPAAIGGAIGSAVADAVFGSAERRRLRRVTMRTCMGFKGYRTYGLTKSLWEEFNFDEGLTQVPEERRQRLLQMQARAASGAVPAVGEMTE